MAIVSRERHVLAMYGVLYILYNPFYRRHVHWLFVICVAKKTGAARDTGLSFVICRMKCSCLFAGGSKRPRTVAGSSGSRWSYSGPI